MEYLPARRMALAKDLPRHQDFGIAEGAERVGHGSASTLSTASAAMSAIVIRKLRHGENGGVTVPAPSLVRVLALAVTSGSACFVGGIGCRFAEPAARFTGRWQLPPSHARLLMERRQQHLGRFGPRPIETEGRLRFRFLHLRGERLGFSRESKVAIGKFGKLVLARIGVCLVDEPP